MMKNVRQRLVRWLLPVRRPETVGGVETLSGQAVPAEKGSPETDLGGGLRFLRILPPDTSILFERQSRLDQPGSPTAWDRTGPIESPELLSGFAEIPRPELVAYVFASNETISGSPTPSRAARAEYPDLARRLRLILQPPVLERMNVPDIFPDGRRPYSFQFEGIRWLLDHPEGLLADEMGLGKTMQAILAMRVLFNRGELSRVLVVAPASVGATWEHELMLWAPELTAVRVQGDQAQRDAQWRSGAEVHIVSYESLARDMQRPSPIGSIPFDLCITDEAQKIKNPSTANARAVRSVSAECQSRWALTGTPLENSVSDVVSIFRFIAPSLRLDPQTQSPESLRDAISPHLLRRTKRQVDIEFPDLRHDAHWLDLSPRQRTAYQRAEYVGVQTLRALGINATRLHIFSLITRLKLICNHDDVSGESCKLDFLQDSLDEISAHGEKALVFSQYPRMTLSKVADRLQRFNPLRFDGSLSPHQRERIVEQFQQQDKHGILLMGIRSGGMGITLNSANHVFHFDHWWNPSIVDQGSARVHRIGQQRAVFIHSLYTRDTIEERIADILSRKRQLFQDVFGQLEEDRGVSILSDEELFGLFGLEPPDIVHRPDSG